MDALFSFPGQSDTPDSPQSGITRLGADVTVAGSLSFRETAVTAALALKLLASNVMVADPVPEGA
jgi:hypothetical protein